VVAFYNCYAFTNAGERVILTLGLSYDEAMARCEYEVRFLADEFHTPLFRHGDTWYEEGWLPRVTLHAVQHDPFAKTNAGVVWMPATGG